MTTGMPIVSLIAAAWVPATICRGCGGCAGSGSSCARMRSTCGGRCASCIRGSRSMSCHGVTAASWWARQSSRAKIRARSPCGRRWNCWVSAYALHPAFGEAQVIEMGAGVRPAFADNVPRAVVQGKTVYVNGMFRHGFLLAPAFGRAGGGLSGDWRDRQPGILQSIGLATSPSGYPRLPSPKSSARCASLVNMRSSVLRSDSPSGRQELGFPFKRQRRDLAKEAAPPPV